MFGEGSGGWMEERCYMIQAASDLQRALMYNELFVLFFFFLLLTQSQTVEITKKKKQKTKQNKKKS